MAEMYLGLQREAQIAVMANMEGLARTFPNLDRTVEIPQPLPKKNSYRVVVSPPGMPSALRPVASSPRSQILDLHVKAKQLPVHALLKHLESIKAQFPADANLTLRSIQVG